MSKSRFEKHCMLCGTRYEYCGNCDRYRNFPRWMETLDTNNCRTILHTIMEYKAGLKTVAEAAEILRSCDLSYRDKIKAKDEKMDAYISAILVDGAEAVSKEQEIDVVEDPKVDVYEEEKVEAKVEELKQEKKQYTGYKKNYKK